MARIEAQCAIRISPVPTMNKATEDLIERAVQYRRESNLDGAGREWAEVAELSRREDDVSTLIRALNGIAQIERDRGRNFEASTRYEEAVLLCREHGDPLLLAHTIRHLGDVRRHLGQQSDAHACYEEALVIYRSEPGANPLDLANTLRPFAILKEKMGDIGGARAFWREARDLYQSLNIDAGILECSNHLAQLGEFD